MKRSKKVLLLSFALLLLCFLVTACKGSAERPVDLSSETDEVTSLRLQLDYCESRIRELESELTAAKVQLYLQRSEYEKKLLAIESDAKPTESPAEPEAVVETPAPVWFHEARADGVVITGVSVFGECLEIPAELGGLPVVAIGENAFANCGFSSAILPESIRQIGWFAFSGCQKLVSISIPASVEEIGYGAFENCPKNLQFLCDEGSYAASYARSYGFAVKSD